MVNGEHLKTLGSEDINITNFGTHLINFAFVSLFLIFFLSFSAFIELWEIMNFYLGLADELLARLQRKKKIFNILLLRALETLFSFRFLP